MVIHNMGNFAVTWIAKDYLLAADTEAAVFKAAAYAILLTAKWGVTLASFFFILGVIIYSSVIQKGSKFVGWFGIIAGTLSIPAMVVGWLGPQYEMLSYRLWGPMLIWQITFGVWLISKKRTLINRSIKVVRNISLYSVHIYSPFIRQVPPHAAEAA